MSLFFFMEVAHLVIFEPTIFLHPFLGRNKYQLKSELIGNFLVLLLLLLLF